MISLGERLDNIHLRVQVPGTEINGELRNRRDISISFGPDVYPWLSERHLEHYMATVARLLYVAWLREYRAALSDSNIDVDYPDDQNDRDFLAARDEMESRGSSSDGRVTISAVGMQNVQVQIARGTIRELSERQFVATAKEAISALADDHMAKIRELKLRFYG